MSTSISDLEPEFQDRVRLWLAELNRLGIQYVVTSTTRSRAQQEALYRRSLQGLQPYPVAQPGTSSHELGRAIDVAFSIPQGLSVGIDLARQVGITWAGPRDPVHFGFRQDFPQEVIRAAVGRGVVQELTIPSLLYSALTAPEDPNCC